LVSAGLAILLFAGFVLTPNAATAALVVFVQLVFLLTGGWRLLLLVASARRAPEPPRPIAWPRYTILAALHDEAAVVPQLIANLSAIDYPKERLQGFLVLEAHDHATIAAVRAAARPQWLMMMIVPPGLPRTKPRALNHALPHVRGDLLTVYDAEDDPHPLQLREAAARFAADPGLACVQAPLRIRRRHRRPEDSPFLDRQFAVEYASLFEVTLPGMARLGLPFPLGGTSNHLRVSALRAVGGWDAYNVTEDADLGFRLWRHGFRLGVIGRPTYETPPGDLGAWLPQRTRWLKGFMQTWGVHTRTPSELGWRGLLALTTTVGMGIIAAAVHAHSVAWLMAALLIALVAGTTPATPLLAICVMGWGAASAWVCCAVGAGRAGLRYEVRDMVVAPAYWSLLSLAFGHALWRLITEPHAWDKTPHRPDAPEQALAEAMVERPAPRRGGRKAA
jgi:cellulose synthase/poly-beta-1,6-N-acetylglucosamine synthase-like glycosyltransferase